MSDDTRQMVEENAAGALKRARAGPPALRAEWSQRSDMAAYPCELQAAADHVHLVRLASLDAFLAGEIPVQKLSLHMRVPAHDTGHHSTQLETGPNTVTELTLAFGDNRPPVAGEIVSETGQIHSLRAVYPRPLRNNVFWSPLRSVGGPAWDFGWLGVYLLARKLLRVA